MKTKIFKNKIVNTMLLAGALGITLATVAPKVNVARADNPKVIEITAKKFEFSPSEITIKKGRVEQSNFHDYRMLRIDQVPKIEVHMIKSGEPPGGVGETGTTAGPPALRNAIFAATGVALNRLPIDRNLLAKRSNA